MNQEINIQCPSCRRVHQSAVPHLEAANCSRCGCELDELIRIKNLSNNFFHLGWQAARVAHYHEALEHVERSWELSKEDQTAELGLWLSVIIKDLECLNVWRARAH